jgi:hypothetical protein
MSSFDKKKGNKENNKKAVAFVTFWGSTALPIPASRRLTVTTSMAI